MGAKLTAYDTKLAERLEKIRKRHGLTQDQMAEAMGVEIGQYKNYIYHKAKVPAEKLATLIKNLNLDAEYVLYGTASSNYSFVRILGTAGYGDLSELFSEISRLYREKEKAEQELDYIVDKDTVVEARKKDK